MRSELTTPERTGGASGCLPEVIRREPPRGSLIAILCKGLIRQWGLCFCSTYCSSEGLIIVQSIPALFAAYWQAILEQKSMRNTNRPVSAAYFLCRIDTRHQCDQEAYHTLQVFYCLQASCSRHMTPLLARQTLPSRTLGFYSDSRDASATA